MDNGDDIGSRLCELPADDIGVCRASPLDVDPSDVGAVAAADLGEAVGKVASDDRQDARARRNEIRDCGLHRGRAGPRDGERQRAVRRLTHAPEPRPCVVHDREELGIEMAEHRRAERAHDPR